MIIPFFISHAGCTHQCVFCDQKRITGAAPLIDPDLIPRTIKNYLASRTSAVPARVAFYGGTFTALPSAVQCSYLDAVRPFITEGKIAGIGLSTRPDCITSGGLDVLQQRHVDIVELGVQSLDDHILARSGRGHTARQTLDAFALLRSRSFRIGVQLMPGLPGDSPDTFEDTVRHVIELKPDLVRLYPALVLRDTPLAELFATGRYTPLSFAAAVATCKKAILQFHEARISVVRVGLQPSEELEKEGTVIAGPYHPAFRQIVESSILLDRMRDALRSGQKTGSAIILVNPRDVSTAIGQKRHNLHELQKETGLTIEIKPDPGMPRMSVRVTRPERLRG